MPSKKVPLSADRSCLISSPVQTSVSTLAFRVPTPPPMSGPAISAPTAPNARGAPSAEAAVAPIIAFTINAMIILIHFIIVVFV